MAQRLLRALLTLLVGLPMFLTPSVLLLTASPDVALAQSDPRKARKAFQDGKKAYRKGDFDKAAALFKEAYGHDAKPQILFNIGQSLKETGQYVEAEKYYKQYLDDLPDAPNREEVLEILFELQQLMAAAMAIVTVEADRPGLDVYVDDETEPRCQTPCIVNVSPGNHEIAVVGQGIERTVQSIAPEAQQELTVSLKATVSADTPGSLDIRTDIENASLIVDGKPAGRLPLAGTLKLAPGQYPIAIERDGETVWRGNASIQPGQATDLNVPLRAKLEDSDSGGGGGGGMTIAAYSLWGLGVGALGAGAFFGLSASSVETDLDDQLGRGEVPNPELIAQGEDNALMANVFLATGVAAIGTGVLLYLLDDGGGASETPSANVSITEDGAFVGISTPF